MSPWRIENGCETLANLRAGCYAEVLEVGDAKGSTRLRELGFAPGAGVEVLRAGETLLIKLGEQRLCMRAESAETVSVLPYD